MIKGKILLSTFTQVLHLTIESRYLYFSFFFNVMQIHAYTQIHVGSKHCTFHFSAFA